MVAGALGTRLQDETPVAIAALDPAATLHVQVDQRVTQRAPTAVAGDDLAPHLDDFWGRCGRWRVVLCH